MEQSKVDETNPRVAYGGPFPEDSDGNMLLQWFQTDVESTIPGGRIPKASCSMPAASSLRLEFVSESLRDSFLDNAKVTDYKFTNPVDNITRRIKFRKDKDKDMRLRGRQMSVAHTAMERFVADHIVMQNWEVKCSPKLGKVYLKYQYELRSMFLIKFPSLDATWSVNKCSGWNRFTNINPTAIDALQQSILSQLQNGTFSG